MGCHLRSAQQVLGRGDKSDKSKSMKNETHFRKLENMYHAAPCNHYYQPRLTVGEGQAEVIIPIRESLFHAAGAAHGAVYFKALDDAAFFAANSLVEDVFVLTASLNVYLTRPVSSGEVRASGRVVSQSGSQLIAEAILYDSDDREIAIGTGCFRRSRIALTEKIGYK